MGIRILPGLLFGEGHPYGQPLTGSGTEASVAAITREDLINYHSTWFKPNNATLVIVGDTNLQEIVPQLEKVLSGWNNYRGSEPPGAALAFFSRPAR